MGETLCHEMATLQGKMLLTDIVGGDVKLQNGNVVGGDVTDRGCGGDIVTLWGEMLLIDAMGETLH